MFTGVIWTTTIEQEHLQGRRAECRRFGAGAETEKGDTEQPCGICNILISAISQI
jgi:hypothetical protein